MVVPWWVCWVFLDLGFVAEVVVVVGWGGGYGGWRWLDGCRGWRWDRLRWPLLHFFPLSLALVFFFFFPFDRFLFREREREMGWYVVRLERVRRWRLWTLKGLRSQQKIIIKLIVHVNYISCTPHFFKKKKIY